MIIKIRVQQEVVFSLVIKTRIFRNYLLWTFKN